MGAHEDLKAKWVAEKERRKAGSKRLPAAASSVDWTIGPFELVGGSTRISVDERHAAFEVELVPSFDAVVYHLKEIRIVCRGSPLGERTVLTLEATGARGKHEVRHDRSAVLEIPELKTTAPVIVRGVIRTGYFRTLWVEGTAPAPTEAPPEVAGEQELRFQIEGHLAFMTRRWEAIRPWSRAVRFEVVD